jgi:phosphonate ABC transporter permease subunit PhnE
MKNKKSNPLRSLGLALGIFIALVIYAYGFQVTQVNLAETKSEHRQQQLFRILRALARPNFFSYEKEVFEVRVPIMIPCPVDGFEPELVEDSSQPHMVVTPACSDSRTNVTVKGYNFEPLTRGPLNLVPFESGVNLQLASIEVDRFGEFEITVLLPNRPSEDAHEIVAITRRNVGSPQLTKTAYDTWNKIIETVFLALLATTLGIIFAIPLSFFAARNLMKDVTNSLAGISLSILLIPIGLYLGSQLADQAEQISLSLTNNLMVTLASLGIAPFILVRGVRWALPQQETVNPSMGLKFTRLLTLLALFFIFILGLYLIAFLALNGGRTLGLSLGGFGFLGFFVRDLGDIMNMVVKAVVALAGAGILNSLAGRWGETLSRKIGSAARLVHTALATAAGAALATILAAIINWFYQFQDIQSFFMYAGAIGAGLGFITSLIYKPADAVPSGLVIYYVSRTIFNALRSVEALVMAIVFVVWVGIGPFAGSLALALHTIASLAKLYSEQVESIMAGPIEAIQSTGANRLQTIIYAVVPQIIPPYISYTMYRWDINVRMSTIIGFVGGGGIGFLLQQNINLLNYRDASAQMIAIAVVVSIMDYISSVMREKVV